ncbi:M81 family metallopeptidase [Bacillus sp. BRMEA1]|uniref:M81 family metallopeptidase n=1 Tax=Neobacillus endophyticus TaxID=2738405 RepID=UPI001566BBAE|nr:M81 family metallopeptidase [Neobacillus endophyticus]NRD76544.1 M81 family metallopeptidase [Neobacillus endophyticus]
MRKHRIGIAFFYHESHSFTPMKTEIEQFKNEGFFNGDEIYAAYQSTKTEVGGFLDVLTRHEDIEIVPLLCAAAVPSGVVSTEAYSIIEEQMLQSIQLAGILDGLLLALHGAMVVEHLFDPEAHLLGKIRELVGWNIPIATTLDMHANLSEEMIAYTPLHFGFKTYPHVDMYEQGVHAASALLKQLKENVVFYAAFEKLPMMPPSINMRTAEGPMHKMMEWAKQAEEEEEIYNVSVFGGFPYSDIPMVGASILVVGLDPKKGKETAKKMASLYWEVREEFLMDLPNVSEALEWALTMDEVKPIALADISDNPLSCGSGDTTELLKEMVKLNLPNTLFGGLYDPESIEACRQAGVGNNVTLALGGKVSPEFGAPVVVEATVIAISDGIFYNSGPFNQHLRVDLKGAAHIRTGNMDILLIGRPMSANDPEMFRHIGLEPGTKRILGLKAKNHFRAAFDSIISRVIYVDAPGVASNRLTNFPYQHIPRPIWPLDDCKYKVEARGTSAWKQ